MNKKLTALLLAVIMIACLLPAMAEGDPSVAVYVAQKNASSVVGVKSSIETWSKTSDVVTTPYSQGSGVVIKDGGYILTNYHVVEDCNVFEILLPSGEYIDARIIGSDSSLDIAVLQADSEELTTCDIGSVSDLLVGSTVVAIGNPGGEVLANTVTMGIVSALERDVDSSSGKRAVNYIQHDAAINSGNSGGGLFDYQGRLVGINTLKYVGSSYSSVSFEGLGFALPIDTVLPLVEQIIEFGKVIRPQLGIYTYDWEGPDEALSSYPPSSVLIADLVEEGPAERAGVKDYDFLVELDGERVTCYKELTSVLDRHEAGDTVHVKLLRYDNIENFLNYALNSTASNSMFGYFYTMPTLSGYDEIEVDITLEIIDD